MNKSLCFLITHLNASHFSAVQKYALRLCASANAMPKVRTEDLKLMHVALLAHNEQHKGSDSIILLEDKGAIDITSNPVHGQTDQQSRTLIVLTLL